MNRAVLYQCTQAEVAPSRSARVIADNYDHIGYAAESENMSQSCRLTSEAKIQL